MSERRIKCPFCVGRLGYVVSTCEDCGGSGEVIEFSDQATKRTRNGTMWAHGRLWSMYEYPAYSVELSGEIPTGSADSMEALRGELDTILNKYGVQAQIRLVQRLSLSPEDRAEKEALDEAAIS